MKINVKFQEEPNNTFSTKDYSFNCKYEDVKVGDIVVVETVRGYQVAKVSQINIANKVTKEVIAIISNEIAIHKDMVEKKEKLNEISKKLNEKVKEFEKEMKYEKFLGEDKEFDDLYKEYKSLESN